MILPLKTKLVKLKETFMLNIYNSRLINFTTVQKNCAKNSGKMAQNFRKTIVKLWWKNALVQKSSAKTSLLHKVFQVFHTNFPLFPYPNSTPRVFHFSTDPTTTTTNNI